VDLLFKRSPAGIGHFILVSDRNKYFGKNIVVKTQRVLDKNVCGFSGEQAEA